MKKLITTAIALAMVLAMSTTAFAAEINQGTTNKTGNTDITFNVDPTYTITIPATVTLTESAGGGYESTADITASAGLRLNKGKVINVTLSTCDYTLSSDEGATLAYAVKAGTTDITDSITPVATFTTENNSAVQTSTLTFHADEPTYAGDYSNTVTFTIAVDNMVID